MERDEWLRIAWRVPVAREADPGRLVFVDEIGANTALFQIRAWSRRGERACCAVPRNRRPNTTLLSSMTLQGMRSSLAVEGSTTRMVFETYVEKTLASSLQPDQIVVMDHLSAHKGERVRQVIGVRADLPAAVFAGFNPIEEAFSKVKCLLRKAEARNREALVEAMGRDLSSISARDARSFFEHCGYRDPVQLF